MEAYNDEPLSPLKGIRVLDLTVMLTGPYLTRILAQFGADVIKIEKPGEGDPLRTPSTGAMVELLNGGKRSVSVNLKTPEGVALIKKMAAEADVFVENFRDGVMDRLGLSYGVLSQLNPSLLYCSLRGLSGSHAGLATHDLNFVAASGVGEWFLECGPHYSTFFADIVGGTFVPAMRILAQLADPNRPGMHLVAHMDEGFRSLYLPRAFETALKRIRLHFLRAKCRARDFTLAPKALGFRCKPFRSKTGKRSARPCKNLSGFPGG